MKKLFISYRRLSWPFTHKLALDLGQIIESEIFVDITGIDDTNFEKSILNHLQESDAILLVVSPDTFTDRIHSSEDWVRREIALGLKLGKPFVLACIDGLLPPPEKELPEDIRDIAHMQGIRFYQEFWDAAVSRLAEFIAKVTPIRIVTSTMEKPETSQQGTGSRPAEISVQMETTSVHGSEFHQVQNNIPPTAVVKPNPLAFTPSKSYRRLIGREAELGEVMNKLRHHEKKIIALIGLGGMGKTALAHEVIERGISEGLFNFVVWASAKTEHFIGERVITTTDSEDLTYDGLLDTISNQCGHADTSKMERDARRITVQRLLTQHKVLIILDNLDDIPEAEKLLHNLSVILGQSKLLLTSRHRLKNEQIFTVYLNGLSIEAGQEFLRDEAESRNVKTIVLATKPNLSRIHKVTGGAPLAMRLIVGQVSRQPLDTVLDNLEHASAIGQDYEFYRFIYQKSWEMLDKNARMVLVAMSIFPPVTGAVASKVKTLSLIAPDEFNQAIDQLVMLSLVDIVGFAGKERFALHPLTQYFIKSDITNEWVKP